MNISEINTGSIGKRVKGIFTGLEFTGTVLSIVENEYTKGLEIKFDEPINWGGHYYKTMESTSRKLDKNSSEWGNLQYTELI